MAQTSAAAAIDDALSDRAIQQRDKLLEAARSGASSSAAVNVSSTSPPLVLPMLTAIAQAAGAGASLTGVPASTATTAVGDIASRFARPTHVMQAVSSGERLREGEVMVVSLPATLPASNWGDAPPLDGEDTADAVRARAASLPSGACGRYRVYASGRMELEVLGVPLEVTLGVPRQHATQLAAAVVQPSSSPDASPTTGEFVTLGPVKTSLVGSVNLEALLEGAGTGHEARNRLVDEYNALPRAGAGGHGR